MQAAKKGEKHHEETIVKRGGGKHHDDEHGGAWKVAFADFCMALMALFLVLWLIAAREASTLKSIVRDNTAAGLIEGSGGKHEIAGNQRDRIGAGLARLARCQAGVATLRSARPSKPRAIRL